MRVLLLLQLPRLGHFLHVRVLDVVKQGALRHAVDADPVLSERHRSGTIPRRQEDGFLLVVSHPVALDHLPNGVMDPTRRVVFAYFVA